MSNPMLDKKHLVKNKNEKDKTNQNKQKTKKRGEKMNNLHSVSPNKCPELNNQSV